MVLTMMKKIKENNQNIIFLGDSFTDATQLEREKNFTSLVGQKGKGAYIHQSHAHHALGRTLARGKLEFCILGILTRSWVVDT